MPGDSGPAEASRPAAEADPAPDMAAAPDAGEGDHSLSGGWFAPSALDPGEWPISWYQGPDDPETGAEPPAPATEEPARTASRADPPQASPRVPVVGATRALRGRAGGPGFQPGRPGPGGRRAPADASPWQTSQRLWRQSDIEWQPDPAAGAAPPARSPAPYRYPPARPPYPVPPPRPAPPQPA
ncbi:MAG TPA: hypothetical protein VEF71_14215, partial [Streptosporangiaceae bacterium]|nr:hypothetical protein [Streptosporangiaceae bacterium]